jgi:hypothetical protein
VKPGQVAWSGERKRKVKTMFFMDIICIKSPFGQVCGSPSLLHTDAYRGTIREQFGNRYARTLWWFWHRLDVIDGFFPLFPDNLSIALKKSRVRIPPGPLEYPHLRGFLFQNACICGFIGLVLGIITEIVCNGYFTEICSLSFTAVGVTRSSISSSAD